MKPRLFIGSSKESLTISYAAQQNLCDDAEITVWNQGVFEPSKTNLESLLKQLASCDFGVFVFSPDDIIIIRKEQNQAVRDNVIFELGLFVGHIGRERCFIVTPQKTEDLRIPTDLIGITPVEYETGRTDDNLQAATGPACNSIRQVIKRLGARSIDTDSASTDAKPSQLTKQDQTMQDKANASQKLDPSSDNSDEWQWIVDYFKKRFSESIKRLEAIIPKTTDQNKLIMYKTWLASAKYQSDPKIGEETYKAIIAEYPKSDVPYIKFSLDLMTRNLHPAALQLLDSGLPNVVNKVSLISTKATCLREMGRKDDALALLREAIGQFSDNPEAYTNLASYFIDAQQYKEARSCLEDGLTRIIDNPAMLETYATLLYEHYERKLALIPYNMLLELQPDNPNYLTYRANIYLELTLNDLAMRDYHRANEITGNKESWIIANIGNLRKNRGFYREAIENLQLALRINPESQYAYERLALSIKLRDEEEKSLSEIVKEVREQLFSSASKPEVS